MVRTFHNPVTSFNYVVFDNKFVKSFDIEVDENRDLTINVKYIDRHTGEDKHLVYSLNDFIDIFEEEMEDYQFETLIKFEIKTLLKIYYIMNNFNVNVSDKQKFLIKRIIKNLL